MEGNYSKRIRKPIKVPQALFGSAMRDIKKLNNQSESSSVEISSCKMQVYVMLLNGKDLITLEVNRNNTIADIKSKISNKVDIASESQTLVFDGQILDDKQSLSSYNIRNDNVLVIKPFSMDIEIFVNISKDKIIILQVNPNDTIENIKAKIQEEERIPTDKAQLVYREEKLKTEQTLSDYNIQNESMLYLEHFITIFVKTEPETIALKVKLNDTIAHVKSMLQNKTDISSEKQCLFHNKEHLIDDSKALSEYESIQNASILHLKQEYTVTVQFDDDGQKKSFVVKPDQAVKDLLSEVWKWLDTHDLFFNDGRPYEYVLRYEEKRLENNHKLIDYHIQENSIVNVSFHDLYFWYDD